MLGIDEFDSLAAAAVAEETVAGGVERLPADVPAREAAAWPRRKSPASEDGFSKSLRLVKEFFTTGNIIFKIGLIVLFFGVSFLLKYAAQRNLVPIELRLTAVALGGLACWRWAGNCAGESLCTV